MRSLFSEAFNHHTWPCPLAGKTVGPERLPGNQHLPTHPADAHLSGWAWLGEACELTQSKAGDCHAVGACQPQGL